MERLDKLGLLRHARACLEASAEGLPLPAAPPGPPKHSGLFVTLKREGALRGCIGCFSGTESLSEAVGRITRQSALEDPRFSPVRPDEVSGLQISLSLLTPQRPCSDWREIEIGRHGVVFARGVRRSVFLPQVAPEQGWNLEQTLDALCYKARDHQGAWRQPDARFFTFEAEVFGEQR